jgi:hypothetical protein
MAMPISLSGSGGAAGPSTATDAAYNPISFSDGSFVVGTSALGTNVAGSVAGATNSFSFGSLGNVMPYLLLGGLAWLIISRRRK